MKLKYLLNDTCAIGLQASVFLAYEVTYLLRLKALTTIALFLLFWRLDHYKGPTILYFIMFFFAKIFSKSQCCLSHPQRG